MEETVATPREAAGVRCSRGAKGRKRGPATARAGPRIKAARRRFAARSLGCLRSPIGGEWPSGVGGDPFSDPVLHDGIKIHEPQAADLARCTGPSGPGPFLQCAYPWRAASENARGTDELVLVGDADALKGNSALAEVQENAAILGIEFGGIEFHGGELADLYGAGRDGGREALEVGWVCFFVGTGDIIQLAECRRRYGLAGLTGGDDLRVSRMAVTAAIPPPPMAIQNR